MRYYRPISRDRVIILIALALSLALALNLRTVATILAYEGNVLAELQNQQAEAKLAVFRHYVIGDDRQEAAALHP